ncbi:MAG: type 1 glutamine amidotransferase [Pseudomonadota bacterium]
MRIAILMANTDESAFADRHPKDGEKFRALMSLARPDWDYPVWSVKDAEFPALDDFDGALITGSPASVNEGMWWMIRLEGLVREVYHGGKPLYGACFGHQIIAKAFGGVVGNNPTGWVKGVVTPEGALPGYASHTEQVLELPSGMDPIASAPGCDIAGFRVGNQIETTQYHPEMTPEFFSALLDEYGPSLPEEVVETARASMAITPDQAAWAEQIAQFFESYAKDTETDPKAP